MWCFHLEKSKPGAWHSGKPLLQGLLLFSSASCCSGSGARSQPRCSLRWTQDQTVCLSHLPQHDDLKFRLVSLTLHMHGFFSLPSQHRLTGGTGAGCCWALVNSFEFLSDTCKLRIVQTTRSLSPSENSLWLRFVSLYSLLNIFYLQQAP